MTPTASLTTPQHQVLTLIATGFTATAAAEQAGVHRNTVTNWLKNETFRTSLEQARFEKQTLFWDQAETLVLEALSNLRDLVHDPGVPPSIRLKAILAMLDHATSVLPSDAPLIVPNAMHNHAQSSERSEDQPPAMPMHNDAQSSERNILAGARPPMEMKMGATQWAAGALP